jgi:hypothetical protein
MRCFLRLTCPHAQKGPGRAAMGWPIKAKTKMTKPMDWLSELARVAVPLAFVSLVAAAVAGITTPLFFAMVLSAGLVIVVIRALFPAGRLFPIAFASLIAVYAAVFSLFVEEIFRGIDAAFLVVGFCLPIFLFVVGCWLRRDQVRAVVAHPAIRSERRVMRAAVWLVPVFLVGTAVILLSRTVGSLANMDMVFLGARSAERRSRWSLGPCVPSQCVTVTVPSAVQAAASVRHRWCGRAPL